MVAHSPGKLGSRRWALGFAAVAVFLGCEPDKITCQKPHLLLTFSDPACNQQCDSYGNCSFPTGLCGTQSCGGDGGTNQISEQICDGMGMCAAYTPIACPGHFVCADAQSCLTSCATTQDCVSGATCKSGACLVAGQSDPDAGC
jgi:hypothetical protein